MSDGILIALFVSAYFVVPLILGLAIPLRRHMLVRLGILAGLLEWVPSFWSEAGELGRGGSIFLAGVYAVFLFFLWLAGLATGIGLRRFITRWRTPPA